ncbi:unnamed protein product [Mytilus coruscus]|uniref:Uncharacterized protein n=1 Tax=Mytilus coruscus TaxID=42192 RepID=A0A6J8EW40_MYTCO|nr:unnamed protein product [Mytilus coruscus]
MAKWITSKSVGMMIPIPGEKLSGKKSICIDICTKDLQLLYKITFYINTGIIQSQGNYKEKFNNNDFPKLLRIVDCFIKFNSDIYPTNSKENHDESDVNETTSDTNSDLNETIVAKDDTIDQNNNKPHATEMNIDAHGIETLTQYQPTSETESRLFMKFMSRMETHFTNAIDKICNQQQSF